MNSYWPYENRFSQWCAAHQPFDQPTEIRLRKEALDVLVAAVVDGEITTLDGVETELSQRISARHGTDQFEMNSNWICTAQSWACPCCSRSKFQVSRLGNKGQVLAKLVIHHDHMGDALKASFIEAFKAAGTTDAQVEGQRLVERIGSAFAAYAEVLICEDCNNADAKAKKKVGCPRYFSFSISQIRSFIRVADHQSHGIDWNQANDAWSRAMPAYELRMRLIGEVSHAAATDTHWYESHPDKPPAIPLLGRRYEGGDFQITQRVSTDDLTKRLGPKKKVSVPNLSRWRNGTAVETAKAVPANFLAILRSNEHKGRQWDSVPDFWTCPTCRRSKNDLVYIGEEGRVKFNLKSSSGKGLWTDVTRICNHCESTLMSLKREVAQLLGRTPKDSFGFVGPSEIAAIIVAKPHVAHSIQAEPAAKLVEIAIQRLSTADASAFFSG